MNIKKKKVRLKVEERQTLEELLKANNSHIEWVRRTKGQEAANDYINHLKKVVSRLPEKGKNKDIVIVELS